MSELEKSERPWGRYEVLQESSTHKVKCIWMKPGTRLSYQRHKHRAEHWFIVQGTGEVTIDGQISQVKPGDTVEAPEGFSHPDFIAGGAAKPAPTPSTIKPSAASDMKAGE